MTSKYSDPSWWPTPPPTPPKAVSGSKLVLGTLLPIAVVAVGIILAITHRSSKPSASGRSSAAFTACVQSKLAATAGGVADATLVENAAKACRNHLPAGAKFPPFARQQQPQQSQSAREAYDQCVRLVLSSSGSSGRSGAGSQAIENASRLCRSLTPAKGSQVTTSVLHGN